MPTYGDVTVQVTNSKNAPLPEYGVRKRDRSRLITCYIESKTDMSFQIRIIPQLPFPGHTTDSKAEDDPFGGKRSSHSVKGSDVTPHRSVNIRIAPWHLLATLRLDGRKDVEKRSIIYLHDSPDFHVPRGEIIMKSRHAQDSGGHLYDCGWLFKEIGVDTVLKKLRLSGDIDNTDEAVPRKEDDDLSTAFSSLGASLEDAEEMSTAGQIEITLERVVLGENSTGHWNGNPGESNDTDMSATEMTNISHTVARDTGKRRTNLVRFVSYESFNHEDEPYATFRFYYRSADKLRKFNFPGFPVGPIAVSGQRQRNAALMSTAPLSILKQKPVRYHINDKGEFVEEKQSLTHNSKKSEAPKGASAGSKTRVPEHNELPLITIKGGSTVDSLDSPPNFPIHDDDTKTRSTLDKGKMRFIGLSTLTPAEGEQSSADESTQSKRNTIKHRSEAILSFRLGNGETTEGEEADDEASDGGQTPNSMTFRDDLGDAVGNDDDGVSRNEPDGGISARLDKVEIGTKRVDREQDVTEGEYISHMNKKHKVAQPISEDQEKEGSIEEEL